MKVKRSMQRMLALVLVLALLVGALPMQVLGAEALGPQGQRPEENHFKTMRINSVRTGAQIADSVCATGLNTFYAPINLDQADTWTLLSYVIEKSQPVELALYRLDEKGGEYTPNEENQIEMKFRTEPEDQVLEPEEFLGEHIGVLYGVPIDTFS